MIRGSNLQRRPQEEPPKRPPLLIKIARLTPGRREADRANLPTVVVKLRGGNRAVGRRTLFANEALECKRKPIPRLHFRVEVDLPCKHLRQRDRQLRTLSGRVHGLEK